MITNCFKLIHSLFTTLQTTFAQCFPAIFDFLKQVPDVENGTRSKLKEKKEKGLKTSISSFRFKVLEWLEVQRLQIRHLPQDARAVFEILDPECECKVCKDQIKEEQHKEEQRLKSNHWKKQNGGIEREIPITTKRWSGHVSISKRTLFCKT